MNLDQLKKLQAQVTPAPWKVAGLSLKHDHAPEPPNTTEQANQQLTALAPGLLNEVIRLHELPTTSNLTRVMEVLANAGAYCGECSGEQTTCPDCQQILHRYAQALADAGLLAPEPGGEAMSYEYAVQYKTPDGWKYSRPSWDIRWQDSEAVQEVRALRDHPDEETRLVRRLVSQPEVMEE